MSLLWVYYHGNVDIEYWEYSVGMAFMVIVYMFFARQKNVEIKKHPEYKHFLWGLFAKIIGGVAFSLIYFYYYKGGDTIAYFYSAVSMSKMAQMNPMDYFTVLFGNNDWEHLSLFNETIGYPFAHLYFDTRSFFLIRIISPIVFLTFHSYLMTTLVLASVSYIGIWRCYRTFVSYFPSLTNKLAIAFLYMPSVVFWGSGIMKDTFTLSAACWWLHCVDEVFFKRRSVFYNVCGLAVSMFLMVMIKPYIFMALFPVTVLWLLYFQVARIRNVLVKFVLVPLVVVLLFASSLFVLSKLGDQLDKFSLDKVVTTVQITQSDMVREEQYGSNSFDVGTIDGTMAGLLSKFPIATNAALFRPYLWECRSVVMVLSALENTWLLFFSLGLLWRTRLRFFFQSLFGNPIVLMFFAFVMLFGFSIGISTPNFGALVRFKIPLVPLMVAGLYIVDMLNKRRLFYQNRGLRFDLFAYRKGEPQQGPATNRRPGGERR